MPEDGEVRPEVKPADEYRHVTDFIKYYSNNVRFEITAWDLTVIFGELAGNLPDGSSVVEQKVAVKLSWPQAKIMAIFLAVNVATHEETNGVQRVPSFAFGDRLKHLGNKDLTLEEMFPHIIKAFNEDIKPHLEKP